MAIQRYYLDTSALIARYLVRATGHLWVRNTCVYLKRYMIMFSA